MSGTYSPSGASSSPRTIDSFAVAEYAPESQLHAFDVAIARTHDAVATHETPSGGPAGVMEAGAFDLMGGSGSSALSVQLKADRHTGLDTTEVQTIASQGTREGGGALPYFERIQAAFGGHDISGIRAHTGSAAREASDAMGAEAFATGHSVAFRSAPTLHTVAHEAAHVIQQRAGVSLKGGVGESGDAHERHADAVADAVVQGRSAEGLLDRYRGSSAGSDLQRQVQRNERQGGQRPAAAGATTEQAGPAQAQGGRPQGRTDPDETRRQLQRHLSRIRIGLSGERVRHQSLDRLRYRSGMLNRVIGRTTEGLGGAGRLPPQNIWQRVEDALSAADAALTEWHGSQGRNNDAMRRFETQIRAAERAYRDNVAQLNLYQDRVAEGGEQAQETLTGVVAACAAALVVAAATVGAAAGTAAVAQGATLASVGSAASAATTGAVVTGGATLGSVGGGAIATGLATAGTTVAFGGAQRASEVATGQRDHFDFQGLLREAGHAAVGAMANAIVGGALQGLFSAAFSGVVLPLAQRAGMTAVVSALQSNAARVVGDLLQEIAGTMLTTAVDREMARQRRERNNERPAAEQSFLREVAENLVRQGVMNILQRRILGAVDARRAGTNTPASSGASNHPGETTAQGAGAPNRLGPGEPEPPRTARPDRAPARFGPGEPEPPRAARPDRAPARFGPGEPEAPRASRVAPPASTASRSAEAAPVPSSSPSTESHTASSSSNRVPDHLPPNAEAVATASRPSGASGGELPSGHRIDAEGNIHLTDGTMVTRAEQTSGANRLRETREPVGQTPHGESVHHPLDARYEQPGGRWEDVNGTIHFSDGTTITRAERARQPNAQLVGAREPIGYTPSNEPVYHPEDPRYSRPEGRWQDTEGNIRASDGSMLQSRDERIVQNVRRGLARTDTGQQTLQHLNRPDGPSITLTDRPEAYADHQNNNIVLSRTETGEQLENGLVHEGSHMREGPIPTVADEETYVRSGLRDEALANARGIEHERQANIPHRNPQEAQVFHDAEQRARAELTAAYPELPPAEIARRAREEAIDVLANHNGNLRPSTSYDEAGRHRPGTPRDYRDFYRRNHAIVTGRGGGS